MEDVAESLLRSGKLCRRRFQIVDLPRGPPQAFVVEFNRHALKTFEARSSICCGGQRIGGGSGEALRQRKEEGVEGSRAAVTVAEGLLQRADGRAREPRWRPAKRPWW